MLLAGLRPEDIPLPDWIRRQLDCFGPDGLLCLDGSGSVLGWNPALEELLEIDLDDEPEWLLNRLDKVLGQPSGGVTDQLLRDASEHGHARTHETVRTADGGEIRAEFTAVLASEDGQPRSFLVYLRPNTPQPAPAAETAPKVAPKVAPEPDRQLTRSFMELQVQHRMLMNRAGGLVLLVDPNDGSILHANEGAEEYLRTPIAELRGSSVVSAIESVDGFTSQGEATVFLGGHHRETELTIPSGSGNAWVLQFVSNTVAWHGRPALLWIGRDVSHRRTAPRKAPGGVQLPASVVIGLAETLRHPAAQIEVAAGHCLASPDRPWHEQRERLERIQELGDRVRATSEDLLYLTRIADGSLDIRRTETTVGRLLAGVLPRLQRRARSNNSELMVVQVDEEAPLFSDARLLMRSLRGFLERALDTEGATVTLTVTVEGDCVRFVIIDSSPRGDTSVLDKVLDPESVTRASTGEFPGLDHLPLMLSVHLARALGGEVEVQSSPGFGSQVTLTLLP
jgi:signal transduction histidine kinase